MWLNSIYGRGIAKFDGATATGSGNAAIAANLSNTQQFGVYALSASGSSGVGVYGNSSSGSALQGDSVTGYGLTANSLVSTAISAIGGARGITAQGATYGVYSSGPLGTSSTSFVNNLYANYTYYSVLSTGVLLYFYTGPATGGSTATFNGNNKPGTLNSTNQWLEVIINGVSYQIPVWQSN
jgi:hypothetical protein